MEIVRKKITRNVIKFSNTMTETGSVKCGGNHQQQAGGGFMEAICTEFEGYEVQMI